MADLHTLLHRHKALEQSFDIQNLTDDINTLRGKFSCKAATPSAGLRDGSRRLRIRGYGPLLISGYDPTYNQDLVLTGFDQWYTVYHRTTE